MNKRPSSPPSDVPERAFKRAKLSSTSTSTRMGDMLSVGRFPNDSPGTSIVGQDVRGTSTTCPQSQGGSTYGVYRPTSTISGACPPDTSRVYENPYLRFELEGQMHRGIPFDRFFQAVFQGTRCAGLELKCSEISTCGEIQENLRAYIGVAHRRKVKEKDLYAPFATLVSSIIAASGVSDFRYIQLPEVRPRGAVGNAKRKPDGVFVHERANGSFPVYDPDNHESHVKWREILLPVELKRDQSETQSEQQILPHQSAMTVDQLQHELSTYERPVKLNGREQVASYALEILSSNPLKRSTMGMLVLGGRVEVWHFDRLGCLGSDTLFLNQKTHFQLFVKMIVHIVKSSAETLGFDPSFKYGDSWPNSLDNCRVEIPVEDGAAGGPAIATIASDEPFHLSRCLSGRGTSVLPVRLEQDGDTLVMKMGWQVTDRKPEAYFYKMAAGVEGLPDIRCSGTIVPSLREGVRGRLEEALPSISDSEPDKKSNRKPGKKPDKKSGKKPNKRKLPVDRSLRVLIMTEKYYPLTEAKSPLHDSKMLLDIMKSFLSVHRSLFKKGVLHRDINPFNLMRTSEYTGRLIDLDLSSLCDEKARHDPEDVPLTFSTPFLALDLLTATTPQRHLYRHDLESLYWSFVWIVLEHLRSKNAKHFLEAKNITSLLETWQKGSRQEIADSKVLLFQPYDRDEIFDSLSRDFPSYSPVFNCLIKLTELVTEAYKHLNSVRRRSRSSMNAGDSPLRTLGETGSSSDIEAASTAVQSGPVFDDSYITGGGYITYEAFSSVFT